MDLDFKLTGFKELENTLNELGEEFGHRKVRTSVNKALKKAMKPVEQQIRSLTPVDTGYLKQSVKTNTGKPKRRELSVTLGPNVIAVARSGWFYKNRGDHFQAIAIEYGTRSMRPQKILRGALKDNITEVLNSLAKNLGPDIEKRAEKLRKKFGVK